MALPGSGIPPDPHRTCREAARGHGRGPVFVATARTDCARPRLRLGQGGVEHRPANRLGGRAGDYEVRADSPLPSGRGRTAGPRSVSAARPRAAPANARPRRGRGGRARSRGRAGGPPPQPGAYIVYALPPR